MDVGFTWSEAKRASNLAKHGLDFCDLARVFDGTTMTAEDKRFWYGEKRYITLGLLDEAPVYITYTENAEEIRILSFRKATRREAQLYFEEVGH